ncbi:uncharacterized protein ARMOST_21957 [Armillaria ostoyae]|uniref:Uncharacterized protein n=1 Tax=Armillaria ostoyae TaxID=47428 RepID=A0A284SBM3_ARMOS|nr:uncharacterized protein ARMOST_21957 [Armillaria ostoyae]
MFALCPQFAATSPPVKSVSKLQVAASVSLDHIPPWMSAMQRPRVAELNATVHSMHFLVASASLKILK